jgi:hypothetical protein
MAVTKFQARHLTGAYITTAVTYDASTALEDETMTANIAELKNLEITPPEMSVEQVRCAGNYAQTIGANARTVGTATGVTPGYFQNMMLHQNAATNWKCSGTAVFIGDEQFSHVLGVGTSQAIAGTPAGTRYAMGDFTSAGAISHIMIGGIRALYNNGSEYVAVMMTNVFITKIGTIKPTGADGHIEIDFEAECLPRDGAIEFAT